MILFALIVLIVLFTINAVYFRKGFYEKGREVLWFGRLMHFGGGFFVGMLGSGLGFSPVVFTLAIGITWEIGEYLFGLYFWKFRGTKKYMTETRDTIEDLVLDVVGAAAWALAYFSVLGYL